MSSRKQEQIGWVCGWLGGFVWVFIQSIVFLVQGRVIQAGIGLLVFCAALAAILLLSPWRHPQTRYRTLMVPIYLLVFAAVAWGAWSLGGLRQIGIHSWWSTLTLLPALLPLWITGGRRWRDGDA